jgi:hypothetical protein
MECGTAQGCHRANHQKGEKPMMAAIRHGTFPLLSLTFFVRHRNFSFQISFLYRILKSISCFFGPLLSLCFHFQFIDNNPLGRSVFIHR